MKMTGLLFFVHHGISRTVSFVAADLCPLTTEDETSSLLSVPSSQRQQTLIKILKSTKNRVQIDRHNLLGLSRANFINQASIDLPNSKRR